MVVCDRCIFLAIHVLTCFLYNATVAFCPVRHVAHKRDLRELTMTTTLSKAWGYLNLSICVYKARLLIYMNILTAVTNFISLRAILCKYGASYIGIISRSDSDFDETC